MSMTYENYLSQPGCLSLEEMTSLHRELAGEAGTDADARAMYRELVAASVKYLDSRSHWLLWDREKKMENDRTRSLRHDGVITAFNLLARYLWTQGKTAAWWDVLGEDRRRIGDFACYIAFMESLGTR